MKRLSKSTFQHEIGFMILGVPPLTPKSSAHSIIVMVWRLARKNGFAGNVRVYNGLQGSATLQFLEWFRCGTDYEGLGGRFQRSAVSVGNGFEKGSKC